MLRAFQLVRSQQSWGILGNRFSRLPLTRARAQSSAVPDKDKRHGDPCPLLKQTLAEYTPGALCSGYKVTDVTHVDELSLVAVVLEHIKTGAEHVHLARDDTNNTFGVAFRAAPMSSRGVSHILEHVVLCGSQKYPVRDPFFKMLNRSMANYMNALTARDMTIYPFATENRSDYYNLMSVYMDAVFRPNLRQLDFLQEGWRLEHTVTEDKTSPVIFKGVVFNEMKGANSNPHRIFGEAVQSSLLPSHTYAVDSGGNSLDMPELTYEELREFHRKHYHPTNARFYTYGDLPLSDHLEYIDKHLLSELERDDTVPAATEVPLETPWSEPRTHHVSCRDDSMAPDRSKQTTVSLSYCLGDIRDSYETFLLSLTASLLVDGETSPFYQSLVEANIGAGYSPMTGLDDYARNVMFSVGLEGVHANDVNKVVDIAEQTFVDVARNGFDQQRLDSQLHRIELALKHQTSSFGMNMLMKLSTPLNHGAKLTDIVQITEYLSRFQSDLKAHPDLLKNIVASSFVHNPHRVTVTMAPSDSYESDLEQEEKVKLKAKVDALSASDLEAVYQTGLELKRCQEQEQDLSCLPMLDLAELRKDAIKVDYTTSLTGNVPVYVFPQPTNQVTYFRARTDTRHVPSHLKPYLPLFAGVVTGMGAGGLDYKRLSQEVEMTCSGLSVTPSLVSHPSEGGLYEEGLAFSSYCLDKNLGKMFELWSKIFNSVDMSDMDRLTTLVRMAASDMAAGLTGNGHLYAMSAAAGQLNSLGQARETLSGISQMKLLKSVATMDDLQPILSKLQSLAELLLNRSTMRCSLNVMPQSQEVSMSHLEAFLTSLPGGDQYCDPEWVESVDTFREASCRHHLEFNVGVNYAAMCVPTVPFSHQDYPALRVMAVLLSNKYLHREIREKGGAYGGSVRGSIPGYLQFFSYRDPRSLETLSVFSESLAWIQGRDITPQDLREAILTVFKDVDAPVSPGKRGSALFTSGITDEMRQDHRSRLRAVTVQDIREVADRYLSSSRRSQVILGPTNQQVRDMKGWQITAEE